MGLGQSFSHEQLQQHHLGQLRFCSRLMGSKSKGLKSVNKRKGFYEQAATSLLSSNLAPVE